MILKRESENKFAACDDGGKVLGTASISRLNQERIFPDCPIQFEIRVKSTDEAKTLLYSAAATRAAVLRETETQNSRVYAVVKPDDTTAREALKLLGFKVFDGRVLMRKDVTVRGYCDELPAGMAIVSDHLRNVREFKKCLKRYNDCFGRNASEQWLTALIAKPDFVRYVVVDENGLCGELLAWRQGHTGVIFTVQTARQFRRMGVASNLIESVRQHFEELGVYELTMEVWRASPGCMQLAENAGFTGRNDMRNVTEIYPELVFV